MEIKVLGAHNCESRHTRCTSLLIDDALALDAGGLTSSLSFKAQLKLKAVLLTHQHYDHTRDIPFLAMNFFLHGRTINVYATLPVYEVLSSNLLDGKLYPNFLETPQPKPTINFTIVEPLQVSQIAGYGVVPIPANHAVPAIGYQVTAPDGKRLFYSGDTGPGLSKCWQHISPQMLFVELTAPDKYKNFGKESGHLTPGLLKEELVSFRKIKGYLPPVVLVHMNPELEPEIAAEIAPLAQLLNTPITLAHEGMRIHL